jgi:hypothetical protein
MGVRAWVGEDQEPLGSGVAEVVMTDDAGNEVSREMRGVAPGMVVTFAHFVDLDDGRRITTGGGFDESSLEVSPGCTLEALREELRECIFDEDIADKPRWEDMWQALGQHGVAADDAALLVLPFVVELGDDVVTMVTHS